MNVETGFAENPRIADPYGPIQSRAAVASSSNIEELERRGYDWVVAARLRGLGKESLKKVVNWERWRDVGDERRVGDLSPSQVCLVERVLIYHGIC